MDFYTLKQHAYAFFIGLISVIAMNVALTILQYIGAHIPGAISSLTQVAAGYGAVKHFVA